MTCICRIGAATPGIDLLRFGHIFASGRPQPTLTRRNTNPKHPMNKPPGLRCFYAQVVARTDG